MTTTERLQRALAAAKQQGRDDLIPIIQEKIRSMAGGTDVPGPPLPSGVQPAPGIPSRQLQAFMYPPGAISEPESTTFAEELATGAGAAARRAADVATSGLSTRLADVDPRMEVMEGLGGELGVTLRQGPMAGVAEERRLQREAEQYPAETVAGSIGGIALSPLVRGIGAAGRAAGTAAAARGGIPMVRAIGLPSMEAALFGASDAALRGKSPEGIAEEAGTMAGVAAPIAAAVGGIGGVAGKVARGLRNRKTRMGRDIDTYLREKEAGTYRGPDYEGPEKLSLGPTGVREKADVNAREFLARQKERGQAAIQERNVELERQMQTVGPQGPAEATARAKMESAPTIMAGEPTTPLSPYQAQNEIRALNESRLKEASEAYGSALTEMETAGKSIPTAPLLDVIDKVVKENAIAETKQLTATGQVLKSSGDYLKSLMKAKEPGAAKPESIAGKAFQFVEKYAKSLLGTKEKGAAAVERLSPGSVRMILDDLADRAKYGDPMDPGNRAKLHAFRTIDREVRNALAKADETGALGEAAARYAEASSRAERANDIVFHTAEKTLQTGARAVPVGATKESAGTNFFERAGKGEEITAEQLQRLREISPEHAAIVERAERFHQGEAARAASEADVAAQTEARTKARATVAKAIESPENVPPELAAVSPEAAATQAAFEERVEPLRRLNAIVTGKKSVIPEETVGREMATSDIFSRLADSRVAAERRAAFMEEARSISPEDARLFEEVEARKAWERMRFKNPFSMEAPPHEAFGMSPYARHGAITSNIEPFLGRLVYPGAEKLAKLIGSLPLTPSQIAVILSNMAETTRQVHPKIEGDR